MRSEERDQGQGKGRSQGGGRGGERGEGGDRGEGGRDGAGWEGSGGEDSGRDKSEREDGQRGKSERESSQREDGQRESGQHGKSEREDGQHEDGQRGKSERESGQRGKSEREDGQRGKSERESSQRGKSERDDSQREDDNGRYKWIALSNTTMGVLIAAVDGSIVIISLPAIFRGIGLDPLAPGNIGYLLWIILGYLLVSAVLVVALGRLGDMFGRVRMYNLGFAIFAFASLALSLDPLKGPGGALWLIGFRVVQAVGGAMLTANSAAILTDAFPARQRGMALGVNQITALAGQFLGLLAGGLLAAIDWRAVFWVSVPIGLFGTFWSYRSLREVGTRKPGRIDWVGNITFTAGAGAVLAAITYGIQPYGGHSTGWTNPFVFGGLSLGVGLLVVFCIAETRIAEPMFRLGLFRVRAFAAGNLAALLTAIARGGLQFTLIIWLQGIWLPLHGYDFERTPLWAGIFMLPLTCGFLLGGPISGFLSDRYGARLFSTTGLILVAGAFVGLLFLPVDFSYPAFAALLLLSGLGQGMFSAPNTSAIMGSVAPEQRGVASGMRATFQNSGTALSIGLCFSLMISGLAGSLPHTLRDGLLAQGVPAGTAAHVAGLPPVSTLFATFLGDNPISHLLGPSGVLKTLPPANVSTLTGNRFFPELVSGPFHHGLVTVFSGATAMALTAALASVLRGKHRAVGAPAIPEQTATEGQSPLEGKAEWRTARSS